MILVSRYTYVLSILGMCPTPKSAGITAQLTLRYLRIASPINGVFLDESQISGRTIPSQARFLRFTQHHAETGTYPLNKFHKMNTTTTMHRESS